MCAKGAPPSRCSVNEPFRNLLAWMEERKPSWSLRLKQQAIALVPRPNENGAEQANITAKKEAVIDALWDDLANIYSESDETNQNKLAQIMRPKIKGIVELAQELDFAIKSQDIPVHIETFVEGKDAYDDTKMEAIGFAPWKGKRWFD